MEASAQPCPWHQSHSCEECLAAPCDECKTGQEAKVDKRRYAFLGNVGPSSWSSLQPISFSSSPGSTTAHRCGCPANLKEGQLWTDAYFGRHFNPSQSLSRPSQDGSWIRTRQVLKLHTAPGVCFALVQPLLWVRKSTIASPWRTIPKGTSCSFLPSLSIPQDFSIDLGSQPSKKTDSKEPALLDSKPPKDEKEAEDGDQPSLQPFQAYLVDQMLKRNSREAMGSILLDQAVKVSHKVGRSTVHSMTLPHTYPSTSSLVCTLGTKDQKKRACDWLVTKSRCLPGGFVVLPAGYGKRVIGSAFLGQFMGLGSTTLPALVVTETPTLGRWRRELERWAPGVKVIVLGPGVRPSSLAVFEKSPLKAKTLEPTVVITSASKMVRHRASFTSRVWSTMILEDCHAYSPDSTSFNLLRALNLQGFWGMSSDPGDHAWRLLCRSSTVALSRLGVSFQQVFSLDPSPYTYGPPTTTSQTKTSKKRARSGEPVGYIPKPFLTPITIEDKHLHADLSPDERERYRQAIRRFTISVPSSEAHHELKEKFFYLLLSLSPYPNLPLTPTKEIAFHRLCVASQATPSNQPCPICKDESPDAPIQLTPCHHRYCFDCLKSWWCGPRSASVTCPICCVRITGFLFEDRSNLHLAPGNPFPLGCEAKLRALEPLLNRHFNSTSTDKIIIASIFSPVLNTLKEWMTQKGWPCSHIATRSTSEAVRVSKAFTDNKSSVLLAPYGKVGTDRDLALNLDGTPVHKIIFMEPLLFVPPAWKDELMGAVTPYYNPSRPKTLETIELVCGETMETSAFIEGCIGSGYSMRFLESTLTTVRILETNS